MQKLETVRFGLFLILLGMGIMVLSALSFLAAAAGLVSGNLMAAMKFASFGLLIIVGSYLLYFIGKLLCLASPESAAKSFIVISVVCDLVVGLNYGLASNGVSVPSFLRAILSLLPLVSFSTFLFFLGRIGSNAGDNRINDIIGWIFKCYGTAFAMVVLTFVVGFLQMFGFAALLLLAISLVMLASQLLYVAAIYMSFAAMGPYIREVQSGGIDPASSAEDRRLRARKAPRPHMPPPSIVAQPTDPDFIHIAEPPAKVDIPFAGTQEMTLPKELGAMHAAVKEGEPEKVFTQLHQGVSLNEKGEHGIVPLHVAAISGVMSVCDLLLKQGVDVDETTDSGLTALILAMGNMNSNMLGFLLSRKANINHQDNAGRTILHWTAAANLPKLTGQNRVRTVKFLLENKADPNIRDGDGKTALELARAAGESDVIPILEAAEGTTAP